MSSHAKFERTYTSKVGCAWRFYYDSKIGRARVAGDDIGLDAYPVYDGKAKGLVMEQDERVWLANAWIELVSQRSVRYAHDKTKSVRTAHTTFLFFNPLSAAE